MIFTYIVGIETSIERHFQFDGKTVGLLLTLGMHFYIYVRCIASLTAWM